MSIKTIPQTFIVSCDMCKKEQTEKTQRYPSDWIYMSIMVPAVDYQGIVWGENKTEKWICPNCFVQKYETLIKPLFS